MPEDFAPISELGVTFSFGQHKGNNIESIVVNIGDGNEFRDCKLEKEGFTIS